MVLGHVEDERTKSPQSISWNLSFIFSWQSIRTQWLKCTYLRILQGWNFPLLHCNPWMGKKKLVMETSRDMVILICQGIASFVPIIAIVNVRLFRSKFCNIYLCSNFKVVWVGESINWKLTSIWTNSSHSTIFCYKIINGLGWVFGFLQVIVLGIEGKRWCNKYSPLQ